MKSLFKWLGLALIAGIFSACGGGDGGGSTTGGASYTIGGTVSGLASNATLVLQNNGANPTTVSANGSFSFSTAVAANGSYAVTVVTPPTGQICTVSGGTGSGVSAVISSVQVNCSAASNSFTVGGTVSGLTSGSVTLQNNGGDSLTLSANNSFTFATRVAAGGGYVVTVSAQPTGQTCTVNAGSGSAVAANISNVQVVCAATTYTVGGTVSGLAASAQVTLLNNGANSTPVSTSTFTFSTRVAAGGSYAVTVGTQPTGQTCVVTNGSGTGLAANVTNVTVTCTTNSTGGSGTGSTAIRANCFNPALFQPGTTWTLTNSAGTVTNTVIGTGSFNGYSSALLVRQVGIQNGFAAQADIYYAPDMSQGLTTYGMVNSGASTSLTVTYSPPLLDGRSTLAVLTAPVTYTSTATIASATSSSTVQMGGTATFLGYETVTVPAGTFANACKFQLVSALVNETDWVSAVSGVLLKTISISSGTTITNSLTSGTINGAAVR